MKQKISTTCTAYGFDVLSIKDAEGLKGKNKIVNITAINSYQHYWLGRTFGYRLAQEELKRWQNAPHKP